jgi:hypothetical protein
MKLKICLFTLLFAGLVPALTPHLEAGIVLTYSGPNAETSSLTGTRVFTFNNLPLGLNTNVSWNGVGSFNRLDILAVNQYGGAPSAANPKGTNYSAQGLDDLVSKTTLTLNQNSGYFGLWVSAADISNVIQFYENGVLVGQFTAANLLADLGSGYKGNPLNRAQNYTQPYVFINFFGDANTQWNSIVFSGTAYGPALESDNYTSRVGTYNEYKDGSILSGTPVELINGVTQTAVSPTASGSALWGSVGAIPGAPEPSISLLGVFGLALFAKSRMSRSKSAGADV